MFKSLMILCTDLWHTPLSSAQHFSSTLSQLLVQNQSYLRSIEQTNSLYSHFFFFLPFEFLYPAIPESSVTIFSLLEFCWNLSSTNGPFPVLSFFLWIYMLFIIYCHISGISGERGNKWSVLNLPLLTRTSLTLLSKPVVTIIVYGDIIIVFRFSNII